MTLTGQAAKVVVHAVRVTVQQIGRLGDSQLTKVGGDGGADIRNVFEKDDIVIGNAFFHRCRPVHCRVEACPVKYPRQGSNLRQPV